MNIRDVARRAKVSTATVSRVISGIDVVKPKTKERVLNAAEALRYVPNSNARSLSLGRSRLFGLLISDVTNPFFPDLIKTFTELAEKNGYGAIVSHTNYDSERMGRTIQRMMEQKVEGVAIMTSEINEPAIRLLRDHKVPLVFLNYAEAPKYSNMSEIKVDYELGIHEAIDHLVELGHKRIAFISGPQELRSAAWRRTFFLKTMEEKGLPVNSQTLVLGNHRVDGGYQAMQKLLALKKQPTAVLASNDLTAFGAISAIYAAGLQVPGDISIVGYDDIEISGSYNPPLTTVQLSRVEIATRAFEALFDATKGAKAGKASEAVPTKLVVRGSTSAPIR